MSKKHVPGFLRFVSMLFKYLKKGMSKKIAPGILRLVSMLFKYLKQGMRKKIVPSILRFISMLFKYLKKGMTKKIAAGIHFIHLGYILGYISQITTCIEQFVNRPIFLNQHSKLVFGSNNPFFIGTHLNIFQTNIPYQRALCISTTMFDLNQFLKETRSF